MSLEKRIRQYREIRTKKLASKIRRKRAKRGLKTTKKQARRLSHYVKAALNPDIFQIISNTNKSVSQMADETGKAYDTISSYRPILLDLGLVKPLKKGVKPVNPEIGEQKMLNDLSFLFNPELYVTVRRRVHKYNYNNSQEWSITLSSTIVRSLGLMDEGERVEVGIRHPSHGDIVWFDRRIGDRLKLYVPVGIASYLKLEPKQELEVILRKKMLDEWGRLIEY